MTQDALQKIRALRGSIPPGSILGGREATLKSTASHPFCFGRSTLKSRAFSLVELLVVVAILAVLAAILFPVFARARENARRASCLSNARQVAFGVLLYKEDTDGVFPPAVSVNPTRFWPDLIEPYVKSNAVFRCPNDENAISFGLNALAFADMRNASAGTSLGALRYERTAENVMLGETGLNDDGDEIANGVKLLAPSQTSVWPEDARPHPRHFERATVAFLDGHVKSLRPAQFYREEFFAP